MRKNEIDLITNWKLKVKDTKDGYCTIFQMKRNQIYLNEKNTIRYILSSRRILERIQTQTSCIITINLNSEKNTNINGLVISGSFRMTEIYVKYATKDEYMYIETSKGELTELLTFHPNETNDNDFPVFMHRWDLDKENKQQIVSIQIKLLSLQGKERKNKLIIHDFQVDLTEVHTNQEPVNGQLKDMGQTYNLNNDIGSMRILQILPQLQKKNQLEMEENITKQIENKFQDLSNRLSVTEKLLQDVIQITRNCKCCNNQCLSIEENFSRLNQNQ